MKDEYKSTKELEKEMGIKTHVPLSAWRKEVRHLSGTEIVRLHRKELDSRSVIC